MDSKLYSITVNYTLVKFNQLHYIFGISTDIETTSFIEGIRTFSKPY